MGVYAPSRLQLDFTKPIPATDYRMVIHSGAYTDTGKAEQEPDKCYEVNVIGTRNLLDAFDCPFVFISTEYAQNGRGVYARSKKLAEELVETHPHHLIIRVLFKTRPWTQETAYIDQYTRGDYLDVIAPLIVDAIESWDFSSKMLHVGTERKLLIDLARQTKPDVKPISVLDIKHVHVPIDYR